MCAPRWAAEVSNHNSLNMSKENIIVGLDIGSSNIYTIIAQDYPNEAVPRVIGVGAAPSAGIRKGSVVDVEEAAKSIRTSIEQSEKMAGVTVDRAVVSIGGTKIVCQNSKGVVAVGKADGEVTDDDINRSFSAAQTISVPLNREIIHISPKSFRLDDQDNIKDPLGMSGVRLEVDAMIIEGSIPDIKNLTKCAQQAGVEVEDMVLESLAAAKAILSKKQKELGVVLINLGGNVTSFVVFEEGNLVHTGVLPLGAAHVTNDIAIGLRTSVEVAERIKLTYGNALAKEVNKKEDIDLAQVDSQEEGVVSRFHVAEIIEARLEEIFILINKELKAIGRAGLLPAGAVLTGGGAKLPQIVELAKDSLGLPAQIGYPLQLGGILDKVDDPSFAVAVGLILWSRENGPVGKSGVYGTKLLNNIARGGGDTVKKIREWMRKFFP